MNNMINNLINPMHERLRSPEVSGVGNFFKTRRNFLKKVINVPITNPYF